MEFVNRMKSEYIRISNVVNGEGQIDIVGPIGSEGSSLLKGYSLQQFRSDISGMSSKIIINIHSLGGSLFEAFGIYDAIRASSAEIETRVIGTSASAATLISLAGDRRLISPNSKYLIHKPLVSVQGNSDEMRKVMAELLRLDKQVIDIYSERTGLTPESVKALLEEERFLTAEEAIEWGFIHSYIEEKDQNKTVNMKNVKPERDAHIEKLIEAIDMDLVEETAPEGEALLEEDEKTQDPLLEEKEKEEEEMAEPNEEKWAEEIEELRKRLEEKEEEVEALKAKLKEKEVEEAENKARTIEDVVDSYIDKGTLSPDSKDEWLEIGANVSEEMLVKLLTGIRVPEETPLRDIVKADSSPLDREAVISMWKDNKISAEEYSKLLSRFKK